MQTNPKKHAAGSCICRMSAERGGQRSFAAVAKAPRSHCISGHPGENQDRSRLDRHQGRKADRGRCGKPKLSGRTSGRSSLAQIGQRLVRHEGRKAAVMLRHCRRRNRGPAVTRRSHGGQRDAQRAAFAEPRHHAARIRELGSNRHSTRGRAAPVQRIQSG